MDNRWVWVGGGREGGELSTDRQQVGVGGGGREGGELSADGQQVGEGEELSAGTVIGRWTLSLSSTSETTRSAASVLYNV